MCISVRQPEEIFKPLTAEPGRGVEPPIFALQKRCFTVELPRRESAGPHGRRASGTMNGSAPDAKRTLDQDDILVGDLQHPLFHEGKIDRVFPYLALLSAETQADDGEYARPYH